MEEKKQIKVSLSTLFLVIAIILIILMGVFIYMQKTESDRQIAELESNAGKLQETINDLQEEIDNASNVVTNDNSNSNTQIEENIVLYQGIEINKTTGIQMYDDMEISDEAIQKYNTTYYNYENGKYEGITKGNFGEETYEDFSVVRNVNRIAMTQKYNAIPREYKEIKELPEQLMDMADCSSVDINEIDLDGDGKNEYIVCYTVNYAQGEIGDGEPQASSGIMLFNYDYEKIADLVTLENGFWANIKEENNKIFLSLDDIEYIDIDNDGIMEIIIQIPAYETMELSIVKYSNNKIEGETDVKASLEP